MKKTTLLIVSIIIYCFYSTAQAPQSFKYQAVARDASGEVLANQQVNFQISILQGSETGTSVYSETHVDSTNQFGLVTLEIGTGTTTDDFTAIDWGSDTYFIQIEMDASGGTSYTLMGTSQLLSVPYALHARTVENVDDADADSTNELQALNISNDTIFLNNGGYVKLPADRIIDADADTTNEIQNLTDVLLQGNDANNSNIINLAAPVNGQDAATKAYVDALKDVIYNELLEAGLNGIVKDVDGNVYKTINIGNQTWMAENLKTTHYHDGTAIQLVEATSAWVALRSTDKAYCYYNNSSTNGNTYGALYTWAAATDNTPSYSNPSGVQGVCPDGWHLPSNAELTQLIDYLGGASVAGGKLKETGTTHWNSPNTGADNSSGFSALPGGWRPKPSGSFYVVGDSGYWWSSTDEVFSSLPYLFYLSYDNVRVRAGYTFESNGCSIRCVRD